MPTFNFMIKKKIMNLKEADTNSKGYYSKPVLKDI